MTGYKSSGYNLDKMELKWLWLDAQAERMNKEVKTESPAEENPEAVESPREEKVESGTE